MNDLIDIQRICVRAAPTKSNPKYYEWQTASICMFIPENDRQLALSRARRELDRRHWIFIEYEDRSTLIEARVREQGGPVLEAFENARRGQLLFKVFADGFGAEDKGHKVMLPARITEQFMDDVIRNAGGQRLDNSGIKAGLRNADYLFGRYIFELKDLQEEAMRKGPHQLQLARLFQPHSSKRSTVAVDPSVLSKLEFREYLNILGRPIQGHVRAASKQIKDTRKLLGREDLLGGLIVLNTGFGTYPHDQFAEQVERYAQKDSSEFKAVISVSAWCHTNGFDTYSFYKMSPEDSSEPEVLAIQHAFNGRYTQMMTDLVRGTLRAATADAPPVTSIAFAVDGIDFAWSAPRLPLPWEREGD